ncbi:MAG: hypothetical protein MI867_02715 [Pseudomonadales bacterium]|nr:hypothetical protein [Pseudomonadales bacterium]
MKKLSYSALMLMFFLPLVACAAQNQTQETARFIIAFQDAKAQAAAMTNQDAVINEWQRLTQSRIEFIRTLSGHNWVVSATVPSKALFIEKVAALENIKYVEEDQVIQISPIERPGYVPVR